MYIAEMAVDTGLSRSVVKRYALTLTELGYTSTDGRDFALTPKALNLGLAYLYSLPFWHQAQLELEELSQHIKQSCAMSILDGSDIVYVVRVPTYKILRASPTLGSRLPASVIYMDRALLAELSNTELDNYLDAVVLKRLTNQALTDHSLLRTEILSAREKGYAWVDGNPKDLDLLFAQAHCNASVADGKHLSHKLIGIFDVGVRRVAQSFMNQLRKVALWNARMAFPVATRCAGMRPPI